MKIKQVYKKFINDEFKLFLCSHCQYKSLTTYLVPRKANCDSVLIKIIKITNQRIKTFKDFHTNDNIFFNLMTKKS